MVRKIKCILPLLILLALAIGCGAVYYNGSANGLNAPHLTEAVPTYGGVRLSWESEDIGDSMTFAVFRSEDGRPYELLDYTKERHFLDASPLMMGTLYRYTVTLCAYNHYGDGSYVFSDSSNELAVSPESGVFPSDACYSADELRDRLIERILAFDEEISLLYLGEWSDGLWENTVKEAEALFPSLSWHYYAVDGDAAYEGLADDKHIYCLTYRFAYYANADERKKTADTLPSLLDAIRKIEIPNADGKNDRYRIIEAVYRYLCRNVTFDASRRRDAERSVERSAAYDALILGRANAKGISLGAQSLLLALDVPCEVVSGDGYCFNIVDLDGEWYHFDACAAVCGKEKQQSLPFDFMLMRESDLGRVKDAPYAKGSDFYNSHPLGSRRIQIDPDIPAVTNPDAPALPEKTLPAPSLSTETGREISVEAHAEGEWIIRRRERGGETKDIPFTGRLYTDRDVKSGILYTYQIVKMTDGEIASLSEEASQIPLPPFTDIAAESLANGNGIRLSWKDDGEEGICSIFRATNPDGPYLFLATERQASSYTDRSVEGGKLYFYKLLRTMEQDNATFSSSPDSEPIAAVSLSQTRIESLIRNTTGNTVVLSWQEVSNADGYLIFRTSSTDEVSEAVFACEGKCTYTDLTALSGAAYRYTVTPYIRKGGERICGPSSLPSVSFPSLKATKVTEDSQTRLEWTPCAEAGGYVLLRSTGGSPFAVIEVTTGSSEVINNAANVSNDFKIYAYVESEYGRLFGQEMLFVEAENALPLETETSSVSSPDSDQSHAPDSSKEPTESAFTRALASRFTPLACILLMAASLLIAINAIRLRKRGEEESDNTAQPEEDKDKT